MRARENPTVAGQRHTAPLSTDNSSSTSPANRQSEASENLHSAQKVVLRFDPLECHFLWVLAARKQAFFQGGDRSAASQDTSAVQTERHPLPRVFSQFLLR